MLRSKQILVAVIIVSVAVLSGVAMLVSQPESTTLWAEYNFSKKEAAVTGITLDQRKGVLVDSVFPES